MHNVRTQRCLFVWNKLHDLLPSLHECSQTVTFCLQTEEVMGALNLAYTLLRFTEEEHRHQDKTPFHVCHVTYEMNKVYTYGLIGFDNGFLENCEQVYASTNRGTEGYHRIGTLKYGTKWLTSMNKVPDKWNTEVFVSELIRKTRSAFAASICFG